MGHLRVCILYASQPDERLHNGTLPAAREYSARAAAVLEGNSEIEEITVGELPLDVEDLGLANDTTGNSNEEVRPAYLFVISCAADGSNNRSARKFARSLPGTKEGVGICKRFMAAVVLLGHARCDNSAKQMGETIYGGGRRFEKSLEKEGSPFSTVGIDRCETQVELEGPETKLDEWLESFQSYLRAGIHS